MGYVDGSIPCPEKMITETTVSGAQQVPNPTYQAWLQQDQLVLSALLSSLSESVLAQVLFLSTSHEVWKALEGMFASRSRARAMQIKIQLSIIRKKDDSVTDYFLKVKQLVDTLASIGQPLDDEEIAVYMLAGLDTEFDPLVTSISTRSDPISLGELYAHMLAFEARMAHNNNTAFRDADLAANNVYRSNRGGKPSNRGRGRSKGGQQRGTSPGNGRNSNDSRPLCQVCGKFGHSALKCYHRFNHSYQADDGRVAAAATTSYSMDPNWYADTSATDHITGDLDKLSIKERYHGKDQVQAANGSGMDIVHIGHSQIHTSNFSLCLKDILHVPQSNRNLLYVQRFATDNNVYFEFHPKFFLVKDRIMKELLLKGKCEGGLYSFSSVSDFQPKNAFGSVRLSQKEWHC
ncbi:hypothetical protein J5N97_006622 [Dioscorea zingiberensis]|uniref:Retrovirus-related Pol polyprotein from transposon TNT 1-94-like beta-barrel domain-containing protein n=1 Tax=Dioscorea zingiberensis TaxID=325984 RepID=A0A9D5DAE1_9LILI|nr:hypothetical protein J5N97_006622 [Dioscorea zingiberensis]